MNILFITHFYAPHIGGVEKHVSEISKSLSSQGNNITILTENYTGRLKNKETIDEIKIFRFSYPKVKFFGLIFIWLNILKYIKLIKDSDVIHIHDVFVWYLPFRFLFPFKKVYITLHGWEGVWPIPRWNIYIKRLSAKLTNGVISVGKYIEKYYGIKANMIIYGGVSNKIYKKYKKKIKNIIYLGRLENDTGLPEFLNYIKNKETKINVEFIGNGPLKGMCSKFGKVHGFCDPTTFLQKSEYCVPSGYLSYIEAKNYGCKILTFANNKLKQDYWKEIKKVNQFPTWDRISDEYLDLYLK